MIRWVARLDTKNESEAVQVLDEQAEGSGDYQEAGLPVCGEESPSIVC